MEVKLYLQIFFAFCGMNWIHKQGLSCKQQICLNPVFPDCYVVVYIQQGQNQTLC